MFTRLSKPLKEQSFFIFGARGTGKTTLLEKIFTVSPHLTFNLLDEILLGELSSNPDVILKSWQSLPTSERSKTWIIIDEIQRLPMLLNHVHHWIEKEKIKFALTGSSARKLKREGINLLAGRAFVYHLHPLTHLEMGDRFDLMDVLRFGSLPRLFSFETIEAKKEFLRAYVNTYLKEEIKEEQLVRNIDPFRRFMEVAGQHSGKIVNYSKIARLVKADDSSIRRFFDILEDTLVGVRLDAFHPSVRARESLKPKFYLFDLGVTHALKRSLSLELRESTSAFGEAFEHFVILELLRLNDYYRLDFKFSYYKTKDDLEVDLIVERPGMPPLLVEIKSSRGIDDAPSAAQSKLLSDFNKEFGSCEAIVLYRGERTKTEAKWKYLPWREGVEIILGKN